jgi:hypothetical protein
MQYYLIVKLKKYWGIAYIGVWPLLEVYNFGRFK